MEDPYRCFVQEIKEVYMITMLADGDPHGYTFWVVNAIKIIKENKDVTTIGIYWYVIDR